GIFRVDRLARRLQGGGVDVQSVSMRFDLRAEGPQPVDRRVGIFRSKRAGDPAETSRQSCEDDRPMSVALRRRRTNGTRDPGLHGAKSQRIICLGSLTWSPKMRTSASPSSIALRTASARAGFVSATTAGPAPVMPAANAPADRACTAGVSSTPSKGAYAVEFSSIARK